jgi:hypothetical protein
MPSLVPEDRSQLATRTLGTVSRATTPTDPEINLNTQNLPGNGCGPRKHAGSRLSPLCVPE